MALQMAGKQGRGRQAYLGTEHVRMGPALPRQQCEDSKFVGKHKDSILRVAAVLTRARMAHSRPSFIAPSSLTPVTSAGSGGIDGCLEHRNNAGMRLLCT